MQEYLDQLIDLYNQYPQIERLCHCLVVLYLECAKDPTYSTLILMYKLRHDMSKQVSDTSKAKNLVSFIEKWATDFMVELIDMEYKKGLMNLKEVLYPIRTTIGIIPNISRKKW